MMTIFYLAPPDHSPPSLRPIFRPFPHPPRKACPYNLLSPKRTPLRQSRLPTRRLAQYSRATTADDDCLRMTEDGCDGEAAGALDVHEEGAGGWYEGLVRVLEVVYWFGRGREIEGGMWYLELVLPALSSWGWV